MPEIITRALTGSQTFETNFKIGLEWRKKRKKWEKNDLYFILFIGRLYCYVISETNVKGNNIAIVFLA